MTVAISRRRLAQAITQRLGDDPTSRQKLLMQLAAYLIAHRQKKQLDLLVNDIARELEVQRGHLAVEVRAAHQVSPDVELALKTYLHAATGAQAIELTVTQDASLVGGLVAQTPRFVLDTSVRHQLNQLIQEAS